MMLGWFDLDSGTWLIVWKLVVIATVVLFAGLVLGASAGAVRDLRSLLRDLTDKPSALDDQKSPPRT